MLERGGADDLYAVLAFDTPDGGWHDICSASAKDHASPAVQKEIACE
jgi:hypothetical protein